MQRLISCLTHSFEKYIEYIRFVVGTKEKFARNHGLDHKKMHFPTEEHKNVFKFQRLESCGL